MMAFLAGAIRGPAVPTKAPVALMLLVRPVLPIPCRWRPDDVQDFTARFGCDDRRRDADARRRLAADALKEIHIDWATYNPVSMILKQKGLLEKEFAKDGISIVWVQSAGSNKALEFLNAGSIDFGSTAGSAALVARINGNPIKSIYVYSRPEWTALVTTKDSKIATVADLKGKRVAVTRGTDPHIFLVRALLGAGLSEKDITPVLLQHADGKTALIRGDVDAWAGLDPMMAQAEIEDGARLFFRNPAANTWGILNVREQFLKDHPDVVRRVLATYEEARKYSLANYDDLKKTFIGRDKAAGGGGRQAAQGAHRTDPQPDRRAAARVDSGRRPGAAAGRRDRCQGRRQGDARRADRRSGPAADELRLLGRFFSPLVGEGGSHSERR